MVFRRWKISAFIIGVCLTTPLNGHAIITGDEIPVESLPIPLRPSPDLWPATLTLEFPGGVCTATAIGPRVILTAAVCVNDKGVEKVSVGDDEFELTCDRNPDFPSSPAADVALCKTEVSLPISTFERIGTDSGLISKIGRTVFFAGYGCRVAGGADRNFGVLSVGQARIRKSPKEATGFIVSKGAALCAGDGGGAVYVYMPSGKTERVIIGVASRSDNSQFSWIAPTAIQSFFGWAKAWSTTNSVSICGVGGNESACQVEREAAKQQLQRPADIALKEAKTLEHTELAPLGATALSGTLVVAYEKGNSLQQIVERACGRRTAGYYKLLFQHNKARTGASLSKETIFVAPGEIEIPVCSAADHRPRIKEVKVKTGDSPWQYFRQHAISADWVAFETSGDTEPRTANTVFTEYLRTLNPDVNTESLQPNENVLVPMSAPVVTHDVHLASVVAGADLPEFSTVGRADPTSSEVQPVFSATDTELQSLNQACTSSPIYDAKYPYDLYGVLDALRRNKRVSRVKGRSVTVLIADSGLYHGNTGIFPLGSTDAEALKGLEPLAPGPKMSHGTQVASLVLGGPVFAQFQGILIPRIELEVHRIFGEQVFQVVHKGEQLVVRKPSLIKDAFLKIVNAGNIFAPIVNLSLKSSTDILGIKQRFLSADSRILFVVAAGNQGYNLNVNPVYPAVYGGGGRIGQYNLLTVASLEPDGSVAAHSNFSPTYVEIGAPGCHVPVLSYDQRLKALVETKEFSGTSLAAPHVTFAAALIKYELPKAAAKRIKKRLLISSDLNPSIDHKIEDGRTLNVVKAVSVHQDLVELKEPRRILRGTAVFKKGENTLGPDSLIDFCEGKISVPVKSIFKLWPYRIDDKMDMLKIYYRHAGSESFLEKADCKIPDSVTISLRRESGAVPAAPYSLSEIRDFVKATRQTGN